MWTIGDRRAFPNSFIGLLLLAVVTTASGTAAAVTVPLETEFDLGVTGPFGTVDITENSGNLDFVITIDVDELGPAADLHEFYFNIIDSVTVTGLALSATNAPNTPYQLTDHAQVAGGAGSSFDWEVSFGNGGGRRGNGSLVTAIFTLSAEQSLSIRDLDESSFTSGGSVEVHMATHVQGTSTLTGENSETIGGLLPIPEPSTALLLMTGLALFAVRAKSNH